MTCPGPHSTLFHPQPFGLNQDSAYSLVDSSSWGCSQPWESLRGRCVQPRRSGLWCQGTKNVIASLGPQFSSSSGVADCSLALVLWGNRHYDQAASVHCGSPISGAQATQPGPSPTGTHPESQVLLASGGAAAQPLPHSPSAQPGSWSRGVGCGFLMRPMSPETAGL